MREPERESWEWDNPDLSRHSNRWEEVVNRLGDIYWCKDYQPKRVFPSLVHTILSQNTSDKISGPASERMDNEFDGDNYIKSVCDAPHEDIVETIKPAGLYNQKARTISECAEFVRDNFGDEETLNTFVHEGEIEEVRKTLQMVPGIGRKTADVVLSFAGGRDGVFAVDTHVHRVSGRMGLRPEGVSPTTTSDIWEEKIPPHKTGWGHSTMIQFGREYCTSQNPDCDGCPLKDICPQIL